MEESLGRLVHFLDQIAKAEAKADLYRNKLHASPTARMAIFKAIDTDQNQQISLTDICAYCGRSGLQISPHDSKILERYFPHWVDSLNYEEFCQTIRPRSDGTSFEEENQETVFMLLGLIETVVFSFRALELIRGEVSEFSICIEKHFQARYGAKKYITKQDVKEFMIDQDIYSRRRFILISLYIFGDQDTKIPWSSFLKKNTKTVKWDHEDQKNKVQEEWEKTQYQCPSSKSFNQKKSCKNIEQVLEQIEQIEKSMKQLKQKKDRKISKSSRFVTEITERNREIETPVKPIEEEIVQSSNSQAKKEFSNQKDEKQELDLPVCMEVNDNKLRECLQVNERLKDCMELNQRKFKECIEGYDRKFKECLNDRKLKEFSSSLGKYAPMKKSSSEAKLKIEEIERRAMEKYLHKQNKIPTEESGSFFHRFEQRENHDIWLEKRRELSMKKARLECLPYRIQHTRTHIYNRNNVPRNMYEGYEIAGVFRVASPRPIRY